MNFAREGFVFIAIGVGMAAGTFALAVIWRAWPLWLLAVGLMAVALWVAYFFRDPERGGERGGGLVIAPADGRIVMIAEVDEPSFLHGRARRISIFMNVFNVHVNRYPVSGTVRLVHYNPGKFLNAVTDKSSLENEQMSVGIADGTRRVLVRQIAGLIARRIVTYAREGDLVEQGERMGIIRFGSRVDVFLPLGHRGRARPGGVTVVARLGEMMPPERRASRERSSCCRTVHVGELSGVFAIVAASRGEYQLAATYIVLGGIADGLDGRVARATGTGSRFGAELDSLVDAISFGLAPAMIMFFAVFNQHGWEWILCFLFTMCAVIRLARFNVEQAGRAKAYFHGLPSPAAGLTLATYYWFRESDLFQQTWLSDLPWPVMLRYIMVGLAFLMISNVRYAAVPTIGYRSVREILGSLVVIGTVAGVIFLPKPFIFPALMAYVLWGVARTVFIGFLHRRPADDDDEAALDSDLGEHGDLAAESADQRRRRRRRRRGRPGPGRPNPSGEPRA